MCNCAVHFVACSLHSLMGGKLKATPHKAETLNVDKDEVSSCNYEPCTGQLDYTTIIL